MTSTDRPSSCPVVGHQARRARIRARLSRKSRPLWKSPTGAVLPWCRTTTPGQDDPRETARTRPIASVNAPVDRDVDADPRPASRAPLEKSTTTKRRARFVRQPQADATAADGAVAMDDEEQCGLAAWPHGGCCVNAAPSGVPAGASVLSKQPGGRRSGARGGSQAAIGAAVCRQSFKRLWVAVISRHSERQAARPRRWKRSILRLNLVSAKTGSIIAVRLP